MSNFGIRDLISKNIYEMNDFISMFIKSSLNIREGISQGENYDISLLALVRDTYVCNMIHRYVGMMTLISSDQEWCKLDNKISEYIQSYYNHIKFKEKLYVMHEYYNNEHKKTNKNYDFLKFLEKMLLKGDVTNRCIIIKKNIRMLENKIFNLLNINPILKISTRHLRNIPKDYIVKNNKVHISLTQKNYQDLIDLIDDIKVRHVIESQYNSRTKNTINDFSKLILLRKELANEFGYNSYYKYINRGNYDNSETIKQLITELNRKINKKSYDEIDRIYRYYKRTTGENNKISIVDIIKYNRIHKNKAEFEYKHVFDVIFIILDKYFDIILKQIAYHTWRNNVNVYEIYDKKNNSLLGRLYLDIVFNENKKIIDPISIRLSDKIQINKDINENTIAEVALIANYETNKNITYKDIITLFREFGYIINNISYTSRVGLLNYDEEFSNYLPLLMEYIAWDKDTIKLIAKNKDSSIIDHIEMGRYIDMCINLKLKCVNATFDHLLHNSEKLLDILKDTQEKTGDGSNIIIETYKSIYKDFFKPMNNIIIDENEYITPLAIVQEINKSQGRLYSNLLNEIFAYTTYWIIKNNKDINFRKNVLENSVSNYRELVGKFLKKTDINYFDLYMQNVIKIDNISEYVTDDNNYFDDNSSDSEIDKEDIITVTRVN